MVGLDYMLHMKLEFHGRETLFELVDDCFQLRDLPPRFQAIALRLGML